MKHKLGYLLWPLFLFGGLLSSCEKAVGENDGQTAEDSEANVVIRVSDMECEWDGNLSRTLKNVSDVCTRLCLAVYQDDKRILSKNQKVEDGDFGTFSLKLAEGSYQMLLVAHSGKANPATTNPAKVQFTNPESSGGTGFTDTFYFYGDLTVTNGKNQVDVSMKRATAMFRLVTTDGKPANVKKFQFYYEGGSGALDATTGYGCVASKQSVFITLDDSLTDKPLKMDVFTFLRDETGSVNFTVKAIDSSNSIVCSKDFNGVSMQRNCITRYSGVFFSKNEQGTSGNPDTTPTEGANAMVIQVNPEWDNIFDFSY